MTPDELKAGLFLIAVLAAVGAALVARFPLGCKRCPHCQAIERAKAEEQERVNREYERKMGMSKGDDEGDGRA
jgi:ssDNA-binding Zn-finger/Zn-ribbon topoisomerase 1